MRKIQIKPTIRYHCILVRMFKYKTVTTSTATENAEKMNTHTMTVGT
jgi:hypothetical protein